MNALPQGVLVALTLFSVLAYALDTQALREPDKTSNISRLTPGPVRFVVKKGKVFDLKKQQPIFFKGIGYSPFLPGETPLMGASPGNDARYKEHVTLMKKTGINYLHVFPLKMPDKFFSQLDHTDIFYSQDIWMFPYAEDFLDKKYLDWKWSIIKDVIDHTYRTGRPDRLIFFSIGDELQAESVARTDARHPEIRHFRGKHIQVTNRTPTEIALARLIDQAIEYELKTYGRRHLYCHTSWTHIGPLQREDLEVPATSALLPDIGDLVCLNIYTYARGVGTSPSGSITGSAYQGYLEELISITDKPIFITQVGLSTSPFQPKPKTAPGFGGHREQHVINTFKAIWKDLQTAKGKEKIAGIAFFEFQDEWWKSGESPTDSTRHEQDDPEEWFGIYAIDDNHKLRPKGKIPETLRKLFDSR